MRSFFPFFFEIEVYQFLLSIRHFAVDFFPAEIRFQDIYLRQATVRPTQIIFIFSKLAITFEQIWVKCTP